MTNQNENLVLNSARPLNPKTEDGTHEPNKNADGSDRSIQKDDSIRTSFVSGDNYAEGPEFSGRTNDERKQPTEAGARDEFKPFKGSVTKPVADRSA